MARIKGKWVGQVQLDFDWEETYLEGNRFGEAKHEIYDLLRGKIERALTGMVAGGVTVTVTQLHADLYRDEPSKWTKEEAT